MQQTYMLLVLSVVFLVTMIYYPTLVRHCRSLRPRALRLRDTFLDTLYSDYSDELKELNSRELWSVENRTPFIVNGVRHPQPVEPTGALPGLVMRLLWGSGGPRFTSAELDSQHSNQLLPIVPLRSKWNSSTLSNNSSLNQNQRFFIKNLYKSGHLWSHPELCRPGATRLLVLVTSAAERHAARASIRLTWGHRAPGVVLVFVLQRPSEMYIDQLLEEDSKYGDLIMGNNQESPRHPALNALSALEWARVYCRAARVLLRTRDDVFVNMPRLLDFISAPHRVNAINTIWGKVIRNMRPDRNNTWSPYYATREEFPESELPVFVWGAAFLLTRDAAATLQTAALAGHARYLRLEAPFLTGLLADAAGVRREHADQFCGYNVKQYPCAIRDSIATDHVSYNEQFQLWQTMHDSTKCTTNSRPHRYVYLVRKKNKLRNDTAKIKNI